MGKGEREVGGNVTEDSEEVWIVLSIEDEQGPYRFILRSWTQKSTSSKRIIAVRTVKNGR
mgnify:CR=1 FL=1